MAWDNQPEKMLMELNQNGLIEQANINFRLSCWRFAMDICWAKHEELTADEWYGRVLAKYQMIKDVLSV